MLSQALPIRLEPEEFDHSIAVRFVGDSVLLDEVTISNLADQLLALAEQVPPRNVILNLGNVEFLNSTTLGVLLLLRHRLREAEKQLRLHNLQPQIADVFAVSRLDRIFEIDQSAGSNGNGE
jgi:anti-sigma B factor antagonist